MKTNMYKEQFKKSVNFSKDFNERTLDNLNALIDEKEAFQNTKKQGNIIRLARRFSAVAAVLAIALIGVFVTSHNLSKPQSNAPVSAVSTPSYNNSHVQSDTNSDEMLSSGSMSATNENANSDIHGNGEEVTSSQDTYSAIYDSEFTDTAIPDDSEAPVMQM